MGRYQEPSDLRSNSQQLSCQVSYRLGRPLIYARGEFDHDSACILRQAINEELTDASDILLLDFSELTYMDSGGLALMFDTVQRFKAPGWLGVIGANAGVSRLMEITGLVDHPLFRLFPDLHAAHAALGGSGTK